MQPIDLQYKNIVLPFTLIRHGDGSTYRLGDPVSRYYIGAQGIYIWRFKELRHAYVGEAQCLFTRLSEYCGEKLRYERKASAIERVINKLSIEEPPSLWVSTYIPPILAYSNNALRRRLLERLVMDALHTKGWTLINRG